ncbi:hypothetical protein BV210_15820 [Halorientalis sp. IM1011]|uniref:hypothetical protein n=1 Tax=Halorientalis sp. IM1011 TaxID=1932360 RepID=UPI00097CC7C4|nr:hypothetical protein [Halorientalis sp. IM1011]AQL44080.1 hypothetical protein BV210_15820 [Halorientalis sp. IM1011]
MSSSDDDGDQGGAGRREVAYRMFAAEYDDADFSYSESDEERAPNYVVTPSGARVNRLFVVGVLTEVEQVNEDVLRARIVDPTGAFVAYAGQYQPDEMAFLDRAEPPTFVALTGKARTFQPDDSDTVYTSVRPESINEVDAETRDRWTVATAERTLDRVETMAGALGREERGDDLRDTLVASGVDEGLAAGTALALEHYGTTPTYLDALRETALDAARVVAGDVDEVDSLTVAPGDEGSVTVADLDGLEISAAGATGTAETAETTETAESTETAEPETTAPTGDESGGIESDDVESTTVDTEPSSTEAEPETSDEPETEPVSGDAGTETPGVETDEEPASEPEPTEPVETEPEPETGSADDDIGDFEPTGDTEAGDAGADDEVGDFDPGEFELDEDEREEIEEEFGTDFSTGTEVGEPGDADIETADPEEIEQGEPATDAEPAEPATDESEADEPTEAADSEAAEEPADAESVADEASADEPAEDVDLEDAVMDAMNDLDDGDGADRAAVIEQVTDRTGADPDAVEEAVQDALMDGRCYEPDEATLKAI